ncbi:CsbD family protein [Brevundimonas sp.]|uniref:CsbD family protein n=1 Tax=Brevundimonas sp. TaxID=1871086 RepID=UPI003BA9C81C
MTDRQATGGTAWLGRIQDALGDLLGDNRPKVEGALKDAKGSALEVYGQAMDQLDKLADKAPAAYQDRAHSVVRVARRKPLLTTALVAGLGYILARSTVHRR